LRDVFQAMRSRALERAKANGLGTRLTFSFSADMRFVGQAFEVPVPFFETELASLTAAGVRQRFGEAHQRVYFFGGETARPIEFVSFRLGLAAPLRELPLLAVAQEARSPPRAIRIFEGKSWRDAQLLRRGALQAEPTPGPALIEDPTSTLYVPSGWTARPDGNGNTILGRR